MNAIAPLPLDIPAPGELREVRPGLHWARMPLPFPPTHVNVWLLEDGEGWLLVDTAVRNEATTALWEDLFGTRLGGRPVTRVLITHFHPDHMGLAGWMCARWRAPLLMSRTEWLQSRWLSLDTEEAMLTHQAAFYRRAGCGQDYLDYLTGRGALYARSVSPIPRAYQRLVAGATLRVGGRDWGIRTGSGHAPEMVCLHSPDLGVLISADQILPRITPYVGVQAGEPEADPLGEFLTSNDRFRDLPADTLVLPSHGEPFHGLHARIDALAAHHAERLARLLDACAQPLTGLEATRALFRRPLDERQLGFGIGETLAHLNRLAHEGLIVSEPGADGLTRYRRAG
ncbi:MBL fold metallo-hydrolase [Roseomonas sp. NAR14]|uniref:MBL fold metallo-hydrolase n=1 Tax=Roseomonas acroporae TaxID=2937791 RepID=A0A9X1Y6L2_9PROT|nr:MBL fold metallo-hydrolase [Roseomonas acroporae]MCK8784102.1 MBL fold metallo-hydrolase [Roseomonas acroporae]